jgi:hypothetical protein
MTGEDPKTDSRSFGTDVPCAVYITFADLWNIEGSEVLVQSYENLDHGVMLTEIGAN